MKFLNYASVALATLPTCAGQGSLRVASKLVPLEDDLETRARAHLDVLFDDTRRNMARRRRLHRLAVDSEKEAWEEERDALKKDVQADLDKYKEQAKKKEAEKKAKKIEGLLGKAVHAKAGVESTNNFLVAAVKEQLNSPQKRMENAKKYGQAKQTNLEKFQAMAADGDAVDEALGGLQGVLDGTKATVDLISKCSGSSGCSGTDIADTVFAVLGTIGGLVTAFGGPAAPIGLLISAVAAIGSFIASFFAPEPVRPVPGLDAAAVEAAAFRAVQKAEDTTTFALFADFANTLRYSNEFNADMVKQIGDINATATDAEVDKLVDGWFDQYHNYKWEDLVSRMKDSGTEYYKAYGDISGSRRKKFADWVKSSKKTCTLDYYLQGKQKGRDSMIKCKKDMADAKTNYDFVENFGLNYVKVATMLVAYWVNVVSILNYHSTCRGEDMDELSCKYYMSFKALQREVTDAMFAHAKKLKATVTSLSKKCAKPTPEAKWPWSQKCEDFPGKCNYQYLLITTQTDQESIVAGCAESECKMLIKEEFDTSDIINYCKELDTKSFYGGILGWQSSDDKLPTDSKTCAAAANKADKFNNDYSMLAIPSYTLDIPDCVSLFKEAGNFGVIKSGPSGQLPDNMTGESKNFTPTSSPTTCPEETWSIKGGDSDLTCWEEKIKICTNKSADARTKMDGHWLKAAAELDWSNKWTQGYQWNYPAQGGVQKKKCTERGFDADEKVKCFLKPLNNGCMYD